MQLNLTGFLQAKPARLFMKDLWDLLTSASRTPGGIPAEWLEAKKQELAKAEVYRMRLCLFRFVISRPLPPLPPPSQILPLKSVLQYLFSMCYTCVCGEEKWKGRIPYTCA